MKTTSKLTKSQLNSQIDNHKSALRVRNYIEQIQYLTQFIMSQSDATDIALLEVDFDDFVNKLTDYAFMYVTED